MVPSRQGIEPAAEVVGLPGAEGRPGPRAAAPVAAVEQGHVPALRGQQLGAFPHRRAILGEPMKQYGGTAAGHRPGSPRPFQPNIVNSADRDRFPGIGFHRRLPRALARTGSTPWPDQRPRPPLRPPPARRTPAAPARTPGSRRPRAPRGRARRRTPATQGRNGAGQHQQSTARTRIVASAVLPPAPRPGVSATGDRPPVPVRSPRPKTSW